MGWHEHEGSPASGIGAGTRTLLMAAALVVVFAGLKAAAAVLVPVVLAAFLAALTVPPIALLRRLRLPTWAAVLVVFVGVIVVFVLVSIFIGTAVRDFSANVPAYQARIQLQLLPALGWLAANGVVISGDVVTEYFDGGRVMTYFAGALGAVSSVLSNTLFVLLTTFFIIAEAAGLPKKIRVAMGVGSDADLSRFSKVIGDLQGYLAIKTLTSLTTALLAGILVFAARLDYALLWVLLAFLLNYVPTLGSIIAAVPPVVLALIQFGWQRALVVGIGYLVINISIGSLTEPRLMGRRMGLSTLVVFLSLVFWGFIWGPLGMLLCVPLTMLVKIFLESSDDLKWIAVLLGSGAEMRERGRTAPPPADDCAPPPEEPKSAPS